MPPKKGPARVYKLPRLLDNSPDLIAIINDQLEVVYANQSCANWLGTQSEELIGKILTYSPATSEGDQRFNGICPSPLLFSDDQSQVIGQIHVIRDGKRTFRQAVFCRVETEIIGQYTAILVAIGDDFVELPEETQHQQTWHDVLANVKKSESSIFNADSLVGTSDEANRIRRQVAAAAANNYDCLIVGPAGSGKEHVARTIFTERKLANAQLVPIHCSIADSELIQTAIKNWVFDRRSNDSLDWLLLLDVDALSVDAQSELLGYTRLPDFQMPIMATANSDLMNMAEAGTFSRSLAMHLSIQVIALTPLSQRMQDLPILVQAFIEQKNKLSSNQVARVSDDVMSKLCEYQWPRNLSELKQYIDAAHDNCRTATIGLGDLPEEFNYAFSAARIGTFQLQPIDLTEYLEQIEKELVTRALAQSENNKTKAARLLGISRARLLRRSTALGIEDSKNNAHQFIDESAFKEAD